jgi:nucleotide-binding universal stress UspA family protein
MSETIFERILIPVDLSERAVAALDWAVRLAGPGTTAMLLHVVETLEDVPFEEMEEFYRKLEERAVETLDRWVEELGHRGVQAERRVVFGHRLHEVLASAGDDGPDVMLLRSHTVDPEKPGHGWGTLSYRLAVLAPCPVLLIK